MSETILNTTDTAVVPSVETEKPTRRQRALQSRRASERLEAYFQTIQQLQTQETLRAQIAEFGYDAAKIAHGAELLEAAQSAYLARQQALTALDMAKHNANAAYDTALLAFRNFRIVAQIAIDDPAVKTALAAGQDIPYMREEFITVARAVYNTVLAEPRFADAMAEHGYPVTVIQNAVALLDNLSAALVARDAAHAETVRALATRNDALVAIGEWIQRLNRIQLVAARAQADAART